MRPGIRSIRGGGGSVGSGLVVLSPSGRPYPTAPKQSAPIQSGWGFRLIAAFTATFTDMPTAGNLLIAVIGSTGDSTGLTVSGAAGTGWTQLCGPTSPLTQRGDVWFAIATGTSKLVTATWAAPANAGVLAVYEWAQDLPLLLPSLGRDQDWLAAAAAITTGPIVTTETGTLFTAAGKRGTSAGSTDTGPAAGFTTLPGLPLAVSGDSAGNSCGLTGWYRAAAPAGSYSAAYNFALTGDVIASVGGLKHVA